MNWISYVAKRGVTTRMPFGKYIRELKRRIFGYSPDYDNLENTVDCLSRMKGAANSLHTSFEGATILEIGSGWFPIIPILLGVDGAKRVLMSDLNHHMDSVTFDVALQYLKSTMPQHRKLNSISRFEDLPITYLVPLDVSSLPDGSIDFIISRTVLEHIPPVDLENLLSALRPKLSSNGLMIHLVDHSDHLEHVDKSISKINFLTWSHRTHAVVNWITREGENRLRHHEYISLFESVGYRVTVAEQHIHEATRLIAKSLNLAPPYDEMSPEELATLSSMYILTPRQT